MASVLPSSTSALSADITGDFEFVDLSIVRPDPAALALAPSDFTLKYDVLPIELRGESLVVAMGSVHSLSAVDDLGVLAHRATIPVLADPRLIKERIAEFSLEKILSSVQGDESSAADFDDTTDLTDLARMAGETAVVQMANGIFAQAVRDGASDIHIEPYERDVKIRYRIDGMLHDMIRPPKRMHAALVSRLKILGEMNIAERRLPQDGRIKITVGGRQIDIRVSIVPTVFGERAVMRILDKGTAMLGLEELGMQSDTLERYRKVIAQPHGIILATGPTGSGKSTSLYASLQEIWSPTTNILTIEDPVEYQVSGISQIQVRANIGLTFANGLRSIVRQDPDVIMVGEIRDHETADIAINAALTGHLVFSTLHTNDAAGAITRLLDMGVEPYLVASSLIGVVAQRLVRRVCSNCAEEYVPTAESLQAVGISPAVLTGGLGMPLRSETGGMNYPIQADSPVVFRRGAGCEKCAGTGYKGRVGLYELLLVDEVIRRQTVDRSASSEMRDHAIKAQGLRTLLGDGRLAILAGKTTPEEVLRVCQREEF